MVRRGEADNASPVQKMVWTGRTTGRGPIGLFMLNGSS